MRAALLNGPALAHVKKLHPVPLSLEYMLRRVAVSERTYVTWAIVNYDVSSNSQYKSLEECWWLCVVTKISGINGIYTVTETGDSYATGREE